MATSVLRLNLKLGECCRVLNVTAPPCRHAGSATSKDFPLISSQPANMQRGTGGRSSFSGKIATVFGATGFLGRAVTNQLGKIGTQLFIPYRGDYRTVRELKLAGDLGQIQFLHYFLKDEEELYKSMQYSNVVVNIVGCNHETPNFPFEEVHVNSARRIARIARECGVQTFIHVSSLNATENPKPLILKNGSKFLASKWQGEQAVREEFPDAIIFRPSDMFGESDKFCGYYGSKNRHTHKAISLWKRGLQTIKQPVFVSDVAKGIAKAVMNPHLAGQTFQAVGAHRYRLHDLVDWFHRVMMYKWEDGYFILDSRFDPILWAKIKYSEFFFRRQRMLSWERLERDHVTDTVDPSLPTLDDLGIELTPLESRVFLDLILYRLHGYVDPMLHTYIRPVEPAPLATS